VRQPRPGSSLSICQPASRRATLGGAQQPRRFSKNPVSQSGLPIYRPIVRQSACLASHRDDLLDRHSCRHCSMKILASGSVGDRCLAARSDSHAYGRQLERPGHVVALTTIHQRRILGVCSRFSQAWLRRSRRRSRRPSLESACVWGMRLRWGDLGLSGRGLGRTEGRRPFGWKRTRRMAPEFGEPTRFSDRLRWGSLPRAYLALTGQSVECVSD
jgi:hypothetical protein